MKTKLKPEKRSSKKSAVSQVRTPRLKSAEYSLLECLDSVGVKLSAEERARIERDAVLPKTLDQIRREDEAAARTYKKLGVPLNDPSLQPCMVLLTAKNGEELRSASDRRLLFGSLIARGENGNPDRYGEASEISYAQAFEWLKLHGVTEPSSLLALSGAGVVRPNEKPRSGCNGFETEDAIRMAISFIRLMYDQIVSLRTECRVKDGGFLDAGLQTLMWMVEDDLKFIANNR